MQGETFETKVQRHRTREKTEKIKQNKEEAGGEGHQEFVAAANQTGLRQMLTGIAR